MPDLVDRSERERAIFDKLGPVFIKTARRVQRDADRSAETDFEPLLLATAAALLPTLRGTYEAAGQTLAGQLQLAGKLDKGLRTASNEWAQARAIEVAQGVVDTTRAKLGAASNEIGQQVQRRQDQREREGLPMTPAEVEALSRGLWQPKLETTFGPQRVEAIAVTEVTGAATAGEEETTNFTRVALGLAALGLFFAGAAMALQPAGDQAATGQAGEIVDKMAEEGKEEAKRFAREKAKRELTRRKDAREVVKRYGGRAVEDSAEDLEQRGLGDRKLLTVWITEADGKVCWICGPLHLEPFDNWLMLLRRARDPRTGKGLPAAQIARILRQRGPSAHPRCRCHTDTEFVKFTTVDIDFARGKHRANQEALKRGGLKQTA